MGFNRLENLESRTLRRSMRSPRLDLPLDHISPFDTCSTLHIPAKSSTSLLYSSVAQLISYSWSSSLSRLAPVRRPQFADDLEEPCLLDRCTTRGCSPISSRLRRMHRPRESYRPSGQWAVSSIEQRILTSMLARSTASRHGPRMQTVLVQL